jgi:hypothetical protein
MPGGRFILSGREADKVGKDWGERLKVRSTGNDATSGTLNPAIIMNSQVGVDAGGDGVDPQSAQNAQRAPGSLRFRNFVTASI